MNLLCFSHLRWHFVYQRPQHLMSRFTNYFPVFFIEEPLFHDETDNYLIQTTKENVRVIQPRLYKQDAANHHQRLKAIIDTFINDHQIKKFISWVYSPMWFSLTQHLQPLLTIYDCMDELSAFKFAPAELKDTEQKLLQKADIVFTGGRSLYNAKKHFHHNIYSFPSSIDKEHFCNARHNIKEPSEQQTIPHPRLGYFGVIDERFDVDLIKQVADAKPEWQFILIGPVVKINHENLPKNSNIHYLGIKQYNELPEYISGWDIALIPFALNASTKFISPTKTPEYLAAGKPVISTAIEDVVHPYGDEQLVHIINSADQFINAAIQELDNTSKEIWLKKTDAFLADISWNKTWQDMFNIIKSTLNKKQSGKQKNMEAYV